MIEPGRKFVQVAKKYRYGFNGKENDNEIKGEGNQQDYGMRTYDPRLGKFLSIDPLIKSYPQLTPYQFASNSPIAGIDVDGGEFNYFMFKEQAKLIEVQTALYQASNKDFPASLKAQQFCLGLTKSISIEGLMYEVEKDISNTFSSKKAISFKDLPKQYQQQLMQESMDKSSPFGIVAIAKGLWNTGKSAINGDYEAAGSLTGTALVLGRGLYKLKGSNNFVFRGTSEGFEGNASSQKLGITPTSTNPAVATVFAVESSNYGKGIVLVGDTKKLSVTSGNVLKKLEQEVAINLKPVDFASQAEAVLSSKEARGILKTIGIDIPAKINKADLSATLKSLPSMTQKQITTFIEAAYKIISSKNH